MRFVVNLRMRNISKQFKLATNSQPGCCYLSFLQFSRVINSGFPSSSISLIVESLLIRRGKIWLGHYNMSIFQTAIHLISKITVQNCTYLIAGRMQLTFPKTHEDRKKTIQYMESLPNSDESILFSMTNYAILQHVALPIFLATRHQGLK